MTTSDITRLNYLNKTKAETIENLHKELDRLRKLNEKLTAERETLKLKLERRLTQHAEVDVLDELTETRRETKRLAIENKSLKQKIEAKNKVIQFYKKERE